jgi:O-antigen ligase
MWVLPFLYYHHAYPLTTFYQEWGTVLLSLCALPLLASKRYWWQPELPRVVLLPIGMVLLLLVQYLLGKVSSLEQTLLLTMYFLWMALLVMLGHRLRVELGLPLVVTVLAWFLAVGAELNTLAGIIQHFRLHTFLDSIVTVKVATAVYGNIAQPNHFANYIALGLASLGLLHIRGALRGWLTALLVTPLLFVLVLSGSRSAWLYLLFMAAIAYLWQRRDKSHWPLFKYALFVLLGFALMHLVVQIPWLQGASDKVTTLQRLFGEASNGSSSIRTYLWKESWLIFTHFPLLGAGFGQFAWQHFQLCAELRDLSIAGLYNNAHNLVMQFAAETGLAGLSILFATLGIWLMQARREERSIYQWWGFVVLAILCIHSLLEYPLWYGYFIGIAAIAIGVMESRGGRLKLRSKGRILVVILLLLGVVLTAQLFIGYKKLESSLAIHPLTSDDATYAPRLRESLDDASRYALLRPYADLYESSLIEVSNDHLDEKLALNENTMSFVPIGSVVYREALLLALDGRLAEAKIQLQRSIWAYPGDFPTAQAELRRLAMKDPTHFSTLLEFATQKYEEYQRAVLAK